MSATRSKDESGRAELDAEFVGRFAARIRHLYPGCPTKRPEQIALHACQKYSGRVGRSAAAKRLNEEAIRLAVVAHIRHGGTHYDELFMRGVERWDARIASVRMSTGCCHDVARDDNTLRSVVAFWSS